MKSTFTLLITFVSVFLAINHGYSQLPWDLVDSGTTLQLNGVNFITPDTGIVIGVQGLILRTTDGGEVWETEDGGLTWDPPVVNGNGTGFNDVVLVGNTKASRVVTGSKRRYGWYDVKAD